MIIVGLSNSPLWHKNFNIVIFSDTINVINVKFCMMVLHTDLYLFILLSVTLTIFQGHIKVKQFQLTISCGHKNPIKLNLCRIVKYVIVDHAYIYYFFFQIHSYTGKGMNLIPHLKKTNNNNNKMSAFSIDIIKGRPLKLGMVITFLWVHQFIPGFLVSFLL